MSMLKDRYIAVLDILGFRARLEAEPLARIYGQYKELLSPGFCKGTCNPHWNEDPFRAMSGIDHPYADSFIFSDSFVLASRSGEDCAFQDLLIACSNLIAEGIHSQCYLRGAMSFGECIVEPTEGVFLGKPIAEAYDLANGLEWIGVSLHPNCSHSSFVQKMRQSGLK